MAKAPIPAREGISPTRVVLRGVVPDTHDFYAGAAGDSGFGFGERIPAGTKLTRPTPAWYHPELPEEPHIPFPVSVLYRGHGLVIAEKPPFLPSTPNGRLMRETVQTRLRVELGCDDIVAVHRLDRLTSGVLALSDQPGARGWYQKQFANKTARKRYRALVKGELPLDETWREFEVPMLKIKGERQVRVDKRGRPTLTRARMLADHLVELEPLTGHTHQLRVLCAHLGAPIDGDDTYPVDKGLQLDNYSTELKLCATQLELQLWGSRDRMLWRSSRVGEAGFWGAN